MCAQDKESKYHAEPAKEPDNGKMTLQMDLHFFLLKKMDLHFWTVSLWLESEVALWQAKLDQINFHN